MLHPKSIRSHQSQDGKTFYRVKSGELLPYIQEGLQPILASLSTNFPEEALSSKKRLTVEFVVPAWSKIPDEQFSNPADYFFGMSVLGYVNEQSVINLKIEYIFLFQKSVWQRKEDVLTAMTEHVQLLQFQLQSLSFN